MYPPGQEPHGGQPGEEENEQVQWGQGAVSLGGDQVGGQEQAQGGAHAAQHRPHHRGPPQTACAGDGLGQGIDRLLYTSPSPRDRT